MMFPAFRRNLPETVRDGPLHAVRYGYTHSGPDYGPPFEIAGGLRRRHQGATINHRETPLQDGRTTAGVVKVGDTVRRPSTANSSFVRQLLHHLEASGFGGAPLALGNDESGRDIFSFLEGDVPSDLSYFEDEISVEAARPIRRYHDMTQIFILTPDIASVDIEVVCHNDLSPCNFVFRGGVSYAIIDFDVAQPGTRLHDLEHTAWLWLDNGSKGISAAEQGRRLELFSAAYGFISSENDAFIANILARQEITSMRGLEPVRLLLKRSFNLKPVNRLAFLSWLVSATA